MQVVSSSSHPRVAPGVQGASRLRWIVAATETIVGVGAVFGGYGLLSDAESLGAKEAWLDGSIFPDYTVPGLFLLIVIGGGMFTAAAITLFRQRHAPLAAGALHRGKLVLEDGLGVIQQPSDQGALAVVHRTSRRQPEDVHVPVCLGRAGARSALRRRHQKYPSRLRSSIAASLARSSARVWPRSVIRVAPISAITSSMLAAVEATAPVQVMSPTVR